MVPQDNLAIIGGIGGGAATFDEALFTFWYEDLVGAPGNLLGFDYIKSNIKNLLTVPVAVTPSILGDWSIGAAINSTTDLLKANTNYAVLGALGDLGLGCIAISGPCTGNVRLGIPYNAGFVLDNANYFLDVASKTGLPFIPVFDSADKGGTFISVVDNTASITTAFILLAELGV